MLKKLIKEIKSLASLNVDKYVRKPVGKCEENVKNKIVVPLLELLGYNLQQNMDFEYHVENKKADVALVLENKPKLLVETKDLDESLDNHIDQGLEYAYNKGVEWVMLTNGLEIRVYKSFIPNIPKKDRVLFTTTLENLPMSFDTLVKLVGKEHLLEARTLKEKAESVRESITAKILIEDLSQCKERLFSDLFSQFKDRYTTIEKFKETIDSWATSVNMDISDPDLIEKLCKEGAYTLINRVLFLRICEDKGHIKAKLSKDAINKWREMIENPSNLLDVAFKEISERFEGLYKSPLFDAIGFEDIDWNPDTINFVLDKLCEHDFSKISKDILGKAYEQHISKEERKKLGQFYTPDFVIDYILNQVGISPEKKVLDPACGSGGFLMKSYDRLKKQHLDQGWGEELIHSEILEKNLFGIDINPFATQLTVMNLLLKDLDHPTSEINVIEGDTLEKLEQSFDFDIYQKESPLKVVTGVDKKLSHGILLRHRPFDIVVGNPPYVSFGLRGVGKVSKEQYKYLKDNYPNSAEYKISMYAVFMGRGIELLGEHGRFGFVVPDSFLLGRFFSKLRRYILDSCKIIQIVLFTKDFWKYGVVGQPVIIILERESNKNLRLTNKLTASLCTNAEDLEDATFKSYSYEQSYFELVPYNRFRLFFDEQSKVLVNKVEQDAIKLGNNIVSFASGLIGKKGKNQIISGKKLGKEWLPGLLSGGEVIRYSVRYGGGYILYDISKIHSGFKDANYFEPKILIRQTGDSIIAAYDQDNLLCLNNLHVGNLVSEDYDIRYVLAILNSKLINHYYHLISLELGRTMAQLDIETIEQLPIKFASKEEQIEVVTLVDKILSLNKQLSKIVFVEQREAMQKIIDSTDREIDNKVYKFYGLTEGEIAVVKREVTPA